MQDFSLLTSAHLLAQLPDAAIIADPAGRIRHWNDAAEELYGWASHEVAGHPLADVAPLPPTEQPPRSRRWEWETVHRHRSGSQLRVAVTARRLRDDDGLPLGTLLLVRPMRASSAAAADPDAAAREADGVLRERLRNLQALVDSIDGLLWSVDTSYRVIAANGAFRSAAPSAAHAAIGADGRRAEDAPGEALAALRTWYDRAFGGQASCVEVELLIDGQARVFECWVTPIYASGGAVVGAALFAQDVATRQRTEAAARDTQNKLGTLFEFLPVGVAIIGADGAIAYTNREHQRIAPGAYDHLEGRQPLRLGYLRPDGTIRPRSEFASVRALQERQPVIAQETGIVDAKGVVNWVSITSVPVEMADWRVITVLTDITARKEAEATVQAHAEALDRMNGQLSRALRLKDEFLANMSHELRTPLNAILGRAELLREEIYGQVTPRQASAVRSIEEAGQHLLTLINDILDLSKIEAGMLQLEAAPLDIEAVARASLSMVAEVATRKRIGLTVVCDALRAPLVADERRLKQILVNLLTNAVKFTPQGGRVGLEVRGDWEAQTLTLTVWDTGIGIAPDEQRRLFQPFVQLDSGLTRQQEGTGLGLALVQRLVERHGGSVLLESELGTGSRFHVVLPWRQGVAASVVVRPKSAVSPVAPQPPAALAATAARPTVLLAEDNAENVTLLKDYLTSVGYTVLVAASGAEALALAEARRPDVILMDIQMPVMDGLEATRRIRASGITGTPIVAVTALAMRGDRERCLEAGADEYLTKPVSLRALQDLIARLLEGRT